MVETFTPRVGDVYYAEAFALSIPDPRNGHPVAVIEESTSTGKVMVIGRSRQTDRFKGLEHPPDQSLKLYDPGVFALRFYQSIDLDLFTDEFLEYRGRLDDAFLEQLLRFVGVTP